jgi:16S rRNA (cytidine1402-2'-O)-methyltransferase
LHILGMRTSQRASRYLGTMNINTDLSDKSKLASGLYIVATPIGNLQDITFRAVNTLKNVDMIYCEDKRQSSVLLSHYSIQTPLGSYHEHNGEKMRPQLLEKLNNGQAIALISDAGTPLISDPGYKLVDACHAAGIKVITIPGPSAPIAALASSGLPSDHFYFGGFLPTKESERRKCLEDLASYSHTQIYFEAPRRLLDTLADIKLIMGDREVCVARELTKTFENIKRAPVGDMIKYYSEEGVLKGEIVLLIRGAEKDQDALNPVTDEVLKLLLETVSTKQASTLLADLTGLSKKLLYQKALELKNGE